MESSRSWRSAAGTGHTAAYPWVPQQKVNNCFSLSAASAERCGLAADLAGGGGVCTELAAFWWSSPVLPLLRVGSRIA